MSTEIFIPVRSRYAMKIVQNSKLLDTYSYLTESDEDGMPPHENYYAHIEANEQIKDECEKYMIQYLPAEQINEYLSPEKLKKIDISIIEEKYSSGNKRMRENDGHKKNNQIIQ